MNIENQPNAIHAVRELRRKIAEVLHGKYKL